MGRYRPPTNLFLLFGVYTSVSDLVKKSTKKCDRESDHTRTHRRTHRQTDANRFYYLSHAICYSMGQIMMTMVIIIIIIIIITVFRHICATVRSHAVNQRSRSRSRTIQCLRQHQCKIADCGHYIVKCWLLADLRWNTATINQQHPDGISPRHLLSQKYSVHLHCQCC